MPDTRTAQAPKQPLLDFYLTSGDAWEAIYNDCAKAERSIELEQYILMDDTVGRRFLELFAQKAEEGVTVRVILDTIGSRSLYGSPHIEEAKNRGIQLYFYNPLNLSNLFSPASWFPRNHVKTTLIDSEVAYTGGVCFDQKMQSWRDTQVRFTGPLAEEACRDFYYLWQRLEGKSTVVPHYPPFANQDFRYVASIPRLTANTIYQELASTIEEAKQYIYLATPFFIPNQQFVQLLKEAAARGVDVVLLLTDNSDISFADYVSHSYFKDILYSDIRLLLYKKNLLHAKYSIIDDQWATIGSTNLDYLSFFRNREANLIIRDTETIQTLKAHFLADAKESQGFTLEDWNRWSLTHKMKGYLGRCFKTIL